MYSCPNNRQHFIVFYFKIIFNCSLDFRFTLLLELKSVNKQKEISWQLVNGITKVSIKLHLMMLIWLTKWPRQRIILILNFIWFIKKSNIFRLQLSLMHEISSTKALIIAWFNAYWDNCLKIMRESNDYHSSINCGFDYSGLS